MSGRHFIRGLLVVAVVVFGTIGVVRSDDDHALVKPASEASKAASALEHEIIGLLAATDVKSDLAALQATLAPKLADAVANHFDNLKPGNEPTVIESVDGRFVVVIIRDAPDAENGKDVRGKSDAELLLVVGGRAGQRSAGGECYGGTGHAEATKGIGIGLGGIGGRGAAEGVGSGGGGGAGATGVIGSIALGGSAGEPGVHGGKGSSGNGVDPVNLDAIVKIAKAWEVK